MKLALIEIIILLAGVFIFAPVLVALLTPATDGITMALLWLGAVAVFLIVFFVIRRVIPRA